MNRIRVTASHSSIAVAGTAILAMILTGCGGATGDGAPNDSDGAAPSSAAAQQSDAGRNADTTEGTGGQDATVAGGDAQGQAPKGDAPKQAVPETGTADGAAGEARLCRAADVDLSLGKGEGTAGTQYRPLRFTNVGDTACVVHGYPGVSYVAGDDGHQVGPAAYRTGGKGDPVTLQPGDTAHAAVGFVQVHNYDPAECQPTKVRGLRVYPPQETNSMFVPVQGTGCAGDPDGQQLTVRTIEPGR